MDLALDKPAASRSPHWPAVRADHLRREPACVACGTTQHVEVHHVRPYHVYPALELEDTNLMTLCESPGHNCHYAMGHAYCWHGWNPHVREDAAQFRQRVADSVRLAHTTPDTQAG